ncbi:hypothetical protein DV738_g2280, partial [Chaetothyriales sp. CBS 135597]
MAETTNAKYTIRYATKDDIPTILALIYELAEYEKAADQVQATPELLASSLSFPTSNPTQPFTPGYARTLLISAPDDAAIAGFALFFTNYSTWRAAPGIYLEDLFVRPAFRKRGYGKALLAALGRECVRIGGGRVEWSVLKWNEPSLQFYQSEAIGATRMEEWVGMRVEGDDGIKKLAAAADDI